MRKPKRRSVATRAKAVGYGFVGQWADGTIGWCLPEHMASGSLIEPPSRIGRANSTRADRFLLCRITVAVVRDSLGRSITRRGGNNA